MLDWWNARHSFLLLHQRDSCSYFEKARHLLLLPLRFLCEKRREENSDVDLLVDTNLTGIAFFQLIEEIRESLKKRVDLLRLVDLESGNPLARTILVEGIKIIWRIKPRNEFFGWCLKKSNACKALSKTMVGNPLKPISIFRTRFNSNLKSSTMAAPAIPRIAGKPSFVPDSILASNRESGRPWLRQRQHHHLNRYGKNGFASLEKGNWNAARMKRDIP